MVRFQSFETMDSNSLTAAIFKDKGVDELVLPTFHPVVLPAPLRIVNGLTNGRLRKR